MHPFPLVTTRMMPFAELLDLPAGTSTAVSMGACLTKDRLIAFGSTGFRNGRIVFFP
jgi:hypothetical protein